MNLVRNHILPKSVQWGSEEISSEIQGKGKNTVSKYSKIFERSLATAVLNILSHSNNKKGCWSHGNFSEGGEEFSKVKKS